VEQNAKCESGWAGKEEGQGEGAVQKFCLFASVEYVTGIEKDFSLKKPHCCLATPFCLRTNETNLFSALSGFCFVTEELGGCDSKEREQAESQIRR